MKAAATVSKWLDISFWGEVGTLALAAPFFYFPERFPVWGPLIGLALLALGWLWRKWQLGCWRIRTPADWALLLLLLLLPLSVWVAPAALRTAYSYPRALILVWNLAAFQLVVVHSGRGPQLRTLTAGGLVAIGALIAFAALFGTRWDVKIPLLTEALDRLPRLFAGVFAGAKEGFSPNQLAGTLLYVLPFTSAWLMVEWRRRRTATSLFLGAAGLLMFLVMLASQSRAGLAGLAVSFAILIFAPSRWGRWLLGVGVVLALASFWLLPITDLLAQVDGTTKVQGAYGSLSIAGRMEIWSSALQALQDFPFTGVGLGAFRGIVHQLYPLFLIPVDYDIAHAHNFFLQSGLDFGLLGLIALLAIYMSAAVQCVQLWNTPQFSGHQGWAIGLLAALLGQACYSLADAVTMGSKTNLLFWWLLALIFGITSSRMTNIPARDILASGKSSPYNKFVIRLMKMFSRHSSAIPPHL